MASEDQETLRIVRNTIELKIRVFAGKEGEIFVCYSPSLNLSGYGPSAEEALESMKVSISAFCDDFFALSAKQQQAHLVKLGWKKEFLRNKNYSNSSIDINGNLMGLDLEDVHSEFLELAC